MSENFCSQLYTNLQTLKSLKKDYDIIFRKLENNKDKRISSEQYEEYKEKRDAINSLIEKIDELAYDKFLEKLHKISPEAKPERFKITIGDKTKEELVEEMGDENIFIQDRAKILIDKMELIKSPKKEQLIILTLEDLGFMGVTTTREIYNRVEELDLKLCDAEIGPQIRLKYKTKGLIFIGMAPITESFDDQRVFSLGSNNEQLILGTDRAGPDNRFSNNYHWVFSLHKLGS